jgi:aldehyde:ferredoxin oxidoreductase
MNSIEEIATFYSLLYGDEVTREQIADIAWKCMEEEWEFNRLAGFGPEDDEMPETMKKDAIGPAKFVWDVPQEIVNQAYKRFEPSDEFFKSRPS